MWRQCKRWCFPSNRKVVVSKWWLLPRWQKTLPLLSDATTLVVDQDSQIFHSILFTRLQQCPVFSSRRTMPLVSSLSLSRQNPDWRHICNLSLFSPALVGHYFQNVEIIKCWKCKEMWIALPQSTQMNTQGGLVESRRLKVLSNSLTNICWKVEISHFNNTWWNVKLLFWKMFPPWIEDQTYWAIKKISLTEKF